MSIIDYSSSKMWSIRLLVIRGICTLRARARSKSLSANRIISPIYYIYLNKTFILIKIV